MKRLGDLMLCVGFAGLLLWAALLMLRHVIAWCLAWLTIGGMMLLG